MGAGQVPDDGAAAAGARRPVTRNRLIAGNGSTVSAAPRRGVASLDTLSRGDSNGAHSRDHHRASATRGL